MLFLVGAGLATVKDFTVRGIECLKACDCVYLDSYTSIMPECAEGIRELTGKQVFLADRETVEDGTELLIKAKTQNIAFVVVGDPLGATTHTDLILRAVRSGISYEIIHNTSILTAVGCCGIQLYNFGATVSIPFWDEFGSPESFYDKLLDNISRGLHTLCLLDIKVKERSLENILKERKIYEPPRFMTCECAVHQLLQVVRRRSDQGDKPCLTEDCLAIGLARVGCPDQAIVVSTLRALNDSYETPGAAPNALLTAALGGPLHSLIIPGELHPVEEEFLIARYCSSQASQNMPRFFINSNQEASTESLENTKILFSNHKILVKSLTPC
ncbi:unnamed protein product [Echinostoma caproni]|uniref:diphthine methyl ester synthase n=1 Tax=Echinostoma caproni TaxID=27848 RepID=A0A183B5X5_9TREM|nr:unnamed protein product [Echinostoma caproni]